MSCGEPHETDCREVLAEVYLYLDLECGEERRVLIREHLEECGPCLREYGIEQEVRPFEVLWEEERPTAEG